MNFGKLKSLLNKTFEEAPLVTNGGIVLHNHALGKNLRCFHLDDHGQVIGEFIADNMVQIFHLNYGVVKYVSFVNDIISHTIRPNPIEYVYFKDSKYKKERELRISLSALGISRIQISDGQIFDFPDSIAFGFNINQALNFGAISHIEIADKDFLPELSKAMEDKRVVLKNSA
jgi:hypothetical protein